MILFQVFAKKNHVQKIVKLEQKEYNNLWCIAVYGIEDVEVYKILATNMEIVYAKMPRLVLVAYTMSNYKLLFELIGDVVEFDISRFNTVKHFSSQGLYELGTLQSKTIDKEYKQTLTFQPINYKGSAYLWMRFGTRKLFFYFKDSGMYDLVSNENQLLIAFTNARMKTIIKQCFKYVFFKKSADLLLKDVDLIIFFLEQNLIHKKLKRPPKAFIERMLQDGKSMHTISTYHHFFGRFLDHCNKLGVHDIDELDVHFISNYHIELMQGQKTSFSKVNQSINAVKFYYNFVIKRELGTISIPRPKKAKALPKVISKEEIELIFRQVDNMKHKAILFLMYSSGLRVGELINLKLEDVKRNEMMLQVVAGKGRKDRSVILSKNALLLLENYYREYKPKH